MDGESGALPAALTAAMLAVAVSVARPALDGRPWPIGGATASRPYWEAVFPRPRTLAATALWLAVCFAAIWMGYGVLLTLATGLIFGALALRLLFRAFVEGRYRPLLWGGPPSTPRERRDLRRVTAAFLLAGLFAQLSGLPN